MKFMSNWNGKVRCVFSGTNTWKLNKVYRVVNGCLEDEFGIGNKIYKDIAELNCLMFSKFEEILDIPQPHKSLLKSGMKVVYRSGAERYVFLPADVLMNENGKLGNRLSYYSDDMLKTAPFNSPSSQDIMEIYTEDGELIAKREEKSTKDTKIEELEKRMRELADEIAELRGE